MVRSFDNAISLTLEEANQCIGPLINSPIIAYFWKEWTLTPVDGWFIVRKQARGQSGYKRATQQDYVWTKSNVSHDVPKWNKRYSNSLAFILSHSL